MKRFFQCWVGFLCLLAAPLLRAQDYMPVRDTMDWQHSYPYTATNIAVSPIFADVFGADVNQLGIKATEPMPSGALGLGATVPLDSRMFYYSELRLARLGAAMDFTFERSVEEGQQINRVEGRQAIYYLQHQHFLGTGLGVQGLNVLGGISYALNAVSRTDFLATTTFVPDDPDRPVFRDTIDFDEFRNSALDIAELHLHLNLRYRLSRSFALEGRISSEIIGVSIGVGPLLNVGHMNYYGGLSVLYSLNRYPIGREQIPEHRSVF